MALIIYILVLVFVLFYIWLSNKYKYWEKRNVPFVKPWPLVGNYGQFVFQKKFLGEIPHDIFKKFPKDPYIGTYYGTEPAILVQDPSLIKIIMTRDFYYFNGREINKYTHREVLTQNMFFTYGDRWRVLRQNLTPLFSSSKMKNMFYLIQKCNLTYEKLCDQVATENSSIVEVRELATRYTMDCIGSCVFGVDCNAMGDHVHDNPFKKIGELLFESTYLSGLKFIMRAMWPSIFYFFNCKMYSMSINNFFKNLIVSVLEKREYKPTSRNDFIDLILQFTQKKYIVGDSILSMKTGVDEKTEILVNDELLVSMCALLFAAGFETSAATSSYTLYELAKNQDAQKRVQDEIDCYLLKNENKVDFNCVTELPYLEACVDETLRLYPVLPVLTREVEENYTLPTGLVLEKGLRVHLPLYHLHRNPDYFPDPESYKPERFSVEQKQNIIPYTYIPFGEGPRICTGTRFAKMQMFPGLITVLKKYTVELAEDMPSSVDFRPSSMVTQSIGGIRLKFYERPNWEDRVYKQ